MQGIRELVEPTGHEHGPGQREASRSLVTEGAAQTKQTPGNTLEAAQRAWRRTWAVTCRGAGLPQSCCPEGYFALQPALGTPLIWCFPPISPGSHRAQSTIAAETPRLSLLSKLRVISDCPGSDLTQQCVFLEGYTGM